MKNSFGEDGLHRALEVVSDSDEIVVKIVTALDEDPKWRSKVNQHLRGEGITNQGRVRSDNIATRQYDGLKRIKQRSEDT